MHRMIWVKIVAAVLVISGAVSCSDPLVSDGKKLYGYYCAHCHGIKGNGNGYNAVNLDPKPRDHTDGGESYMAGRTNDELFEAVYKGGKGIGKSPFMPPWGGLFSEKEIWSLVAYMRTLHKNEAPEVVVPAKASIERPKLPVARITSLDIPEKLDENGQPIDPAEVKAGLVKTGERLFYKTYGCNSCHSINGEGGKVGPSLSRVGFRLRPTYVYEWLSNPQSIKKDTKMPNFQLKDRDLLALTLFLETLTAAPEGRPKF